MSDKATPMGAVEVDLPVPGRERASWGYPRAEEYFLTVAVEADGTVLAWDPVADAWTRCTGLSADQVAEACRLADDKRRPLTPTEALVEISRVLRKYERAAEKVILR
jgi:hypothetical protein